MKLESAINRCAAHLPEAWHIEITIERGAGWADLFDPGGEKLTWKCNLSDLDLHEQVEKLLSYARTASELRPEVGG